MLSYGQRANEKADREDLGVKVYRRLAVFNAKWRSLRGAAWSASITEIMFQERAESLNWPRLVRDRWGFG